jgi:hypothetical protein
LPASLHDDEVADDQDSAEAASLISQTHVAADFVEAVEHVKGELESRWADASGHHSLLEREALLTTSLHAQVGSVQSLIPEPSAAPLLDPDPLNHARNISSCLSRYAVNVAQTIDAWAAAKAAKPSTSSISLVLQKDNSSSSVGFAIGFVHWDDVGKSVGRQLHLDELLGVVYVLPRDKQSFASSLAASEMHIACSMDVGMVPC